MKALDVYIPASHLSLQPSTLNLTMGCQLSKSSAKKPEVSTFRVLNVPAYIPTPESSTEIAGPAPAGHSADSLSLHRPCPVELPSYTNSSPTLHQTTPDSDYHLHAQIAALPGVPPLRTQYEPYRPNTPSQSQYRPYNPHTSTQSLPIHRPGPSPLQRHPPDITSHHHHTSASYTQQSNLSRYSGLIRVDSPAPSTLTPRPFHHIEYPPLPTVPPGSTLDQALAPRGKRRWESLRHAGRKMIVVERYRGTGDERLSLELRTGDTGSIASVATQKSEKSERKREKLLKKKGGARRWLLD